MDLTLKFEEVFHLYYSPLCNYASKIVGDDSIAEDLVQNLFIQLWENNKLDIVKKYEHFLVRATKYKCIDFLRTKRVEKEVYLDNIPEDYSITLYDLAEEDIEPLLHYFVAKLPPKTREVFLLSRNSGLTYKKIAKEMDISVKTVENQMGRALRMMRALLKEQGYLALLLLLDVF